MATLSPTIAGFTRSPTSLRPVVLIGGIPIVWLVVLVCVLVVFFICTASYPIILIIRWRAREKRAMNHEEEMDEANHEPEPSPPPKQSRSRLGGNAIFGAGRQSTRGKWVERRDPESGAPYFEHTGTGEVTWVDPRPAKMRGGGGGRPAPPPSSGAMMPMSPQGQMQAAPMPPMSSLAQSFLPPGRGPAAAPPPQMPPPSRGTVGGRPTAPPPQAPAAAPAAPAADPKFDKYARMQKAGLPEGAVRNAMTRDGISDAEQNKFLGG